MAVDILELATGPGLQRIERLGGLRPYLGWRGPILAMALVADGSRPQGWRAHSRAQLLDGRAGVLKLKSAVDGRLLTVTLEELAEASRRLGAEVSAQITREGVLSGWWFDAEGPVPPLELIVSALAQEQAHAGTFLADEGWKTLDQPVDAGGGPLVEGCACRACAIASVGLLRHLWNQREITAEHLLCWHNLHQMRLRVEEPRAGQ